MDLEIQIAVARQLHELKRKLLCDNNIRVISNNGMDPNSNLNTVRRS